MYQWIIGRVIGGNHRWCWNQWSKYFIDHNKNENVKGRMK
jgi:hypothetical protein